MFIFSNYKFDNPIEIIIAFNNEQFIEAFKKIQKLKDAYYLLGYISYRAKDIFLNKKITSKTPLLYFEVHQNYEEFEIKTPKQKANIFIKGNVDFKTYKKDIEKIKNYISNGTTYEVNYTYSNNISSDTDGFNLYLNLIKNQTTPYCAYIKNDFNEILSFSPELFFEIKDNKITTKPMKGTVKRKGNKQKEIDFLKNDIKNRAENTMIVDLLRNDLSKIKNAFNIKVEKLFEIETHKTLHQMTSTISAELKNIDLFDIFSCIFPCGSITGAPKISTMEIIDKLEKYKRNIYCGAIGMISKDKTIFSVPIRTLEKNIDDLNYTFCSGGAIVYKSKTKEEWVECDTKKMFLGKSIDFDLIETILIENEPVFLIEHLERLKKAADFFGYKYNYKIDNEIFEKNKIARIVLKKDGNYEIQYRKINKAKTNKINISKTKVNSNNTFLRFKTTYRPWYENLDDNYYDTLFFNEKNELTEASKHNVILKIKGKLYTPYLKSGLLDGIYRKHLLDNKIIKEKTLYYEDMLKADKIYLINSVRKMVEVEL